MIEKYKHRVELEKYPKDSMQLFIPTDSEELWYENLKKHPQNHSLEYYKRHPIEYKLNNAGFRTPDDFNSEEWGNVYLGCSHTFGIGHHLEHIWSYRLNQLIGGKFWNLGIGGTGVTTHFRILLGHYKDLKIKNIFHYAPIYPRYEFILNGTPQHYIVADYKKEWEKDFGDLMVNSLLNEDQVQFNYEAYTSAIRGLAAKIGCNYYLVTGDTGGHARDDDSLQARDLMHHTTLYQHNILKEFIKKYDNTLLNEVEEDLEVFNIKNSLKRGSLL